jgi:poly-gamma-glutamate synthesis protein (capsule biosynthesis protein)
MKNHNGVRRSLTACALFAVVASVAAQDDLFTIALTGDSIITRRLSVYEEPEFVKTIDLIRGADVAFTNIEMLFHDYETWPMNQSGGTYMRAEPELAAELTWSGFDIGSLANNHTGDYGVGGMRLTVKHVRAAGLVAAGVGESLPAAREAKFIETARGRVALVACASTFPDHSRASRSRGDMPARPGLSPLRFDGAREATPEAMRALTAAMVELGLPLPVNGGPVSFLGERFERGDANQTRTEPNAEDLREIVAVVNNASRLSDYTIVSIHAHEGGPGGNSTPAEFLVAFARAAIDAGADVFVGHGPHILRGIEIYKGKPIFYSLGDFIFQNETLLRLPQENYGRYGLDADAHVADFNDRRYRNDTAGFPSNPEIWESVVAMPIFRGRELLRIELHPITLGFGRPRTQRGRPMLADAELGRKIIGDLQARSAPFGTEIEWRGGIGAIEIGRRP